MTDRIRYAVVGLGNIAQSAVLPAFAHAKRNSVLSALVGGDPEKLDALGRKYKVDHCVTYREGLNDTRIVRALLDSAERRRPIRVSLEDDELPEPDQAKRLYQAARRPELFGAKAPAERQ